MYFYRHLLLVCYMDRPEYLLQTNESFRSQAIELPFFPNCFDPLDGVFRVLELICDDDRNHPKYSEIPYIVKCKCIWKPTLMDDFLEEFNHWFDLTQLIKDWNMFDEISFERQSDPYTKLQIICTGIRYKDIHIHDIESGNWEFINKLNAIIISDNRNENPKTLIGERLLPLPKISVSEVKVYSFSKNPINYNSGLYPQYAKIIQVTDENYEEMMNYEIGPGLYFNSINDFRNQFRTQMADTVLIKGYYKIYAIRLDPPRDHETKIDGKTKKIPAPWDLPCQFIGIGHWLGPNLQESDPLKFNRDISIEVRLNPLFNNAAKK